MHSVPAGPSCFCPGGGAGVAPRAGESERPWPGQAGRRLRLHGHAALAWRRFISGDTAALREHQRDHCRVLGWRWREEDRRCISACLQVTLLRMMQVLYEKTLVAETVMTSWVLVRGSCSPVNYSPGHDVDLHAFLLEFS